MGTPRQRSIAEFIAIVLAARQLLTRQLARSYIPERRQLELRYQDALEPVEDAIIRYGETGRVGALPRRVATLFAVMAPFITRSATTLEDDGLRIGASSALNILRRGGVRTPLNVQMVRLYVDSPAFPETLAGQPDFYIRRIRQIIGQAVAEGKNPRATATQIMALFKGRVAPVRADIERLTRTVQIYGARRATGRIYQANGVEQWVWSANLDDRTCVMCWFQHGTIHDLDTEPFLNDHHRGRCAMVPVTPRWAGRNVLDQMQDGAARFEELNLDSQRRLLGATLFDAYVNGDFTPSAAAVTTTYSNPIFGDMRRPDTVANILAGVRTQ